MERAEDSSGGLETEIETVQIEIGASIPQRGQDQRKILGSCLSFLGLP